MRIPHRIGLLVTLACVSAGVWAIQAEVERPPTPGGIDYQKTAAVYPFDLRPDQARQYDGEFGPFYSIGQSGGGRYQIEIIVPPDRSMHYRVTRDGKVLHEWVGHALTTFRIADDHLYYVLNHPSTDGGTVVAVDLKTAAEVWRKPLIGLGGIAHSAYFGRAELSVNADAVTVEGDESGGRFVEYLDRATGLRLGHAKRLAGPWAK